METQSTENSEHAMCSNDISNQCDKQGPDVSNNGDTESRLEVSEGEVRGVLEVIASTGKFWHEWDKLKHMLSFQLKQVFSEYPEARMGVDQQNTLLGETYSDLVKRLDEALLGFVEGPPFTLQRLCEILLDARNIYPKLSKLALALEKNLLVASTLVICADPYLPTMLQRQNEQEKVKEETQPDANPIENGVVDGDEIMAEVEADINDAMTIDMETFEEIVGSSDTNSMPETNP